MYFVLKQLRTFILAVQLYKNQKHATKIGFLFKSLIIRILVGYRFGVPISEYVELCGWMWNYSTFQTRFRAGLPQSPIEFRLSLIP